MMKIYLFIFSLFISTSILNAQDLYLVNPNLVINSADVNATDLEVATYLVNNSNQVLNVTYTINDGNLLTYNWPTAAVGICNDAVCDDPSVKVNGSFTMEIGDSVNIKITILPEGITDSIGGTIQFSVPGTQINRVMANYSIKVGSVATSIRNIDAKTISVFPNPASNFIQIKGIENITDIKSLEVYNIIGRKIISKQISSFNDLSLNIQNYESGIYLIKLFNETQNISYTKTFIKK